VATLSALISLDRQVASIAFFPALAAADFHAMIA
jgi:hypothetical protein